MSAQAQLEWAYQTGGDFTGAFEEDGATAIITDAVGNSYITGYFDGNSDFDFGNQDYILNSLGGTNSFVVKLDPAGQLVWVKTFGGSSNQGNSIKLDTQQNIYVGGSFTGTVDFDPNSNSQLESSNGSYDAYVVKLDNNGDFIWVKTLGGDTFDTCSGLTIDNFSNVYYTGSFTNTVDFDLGTGSHLITVSGAKDAYVVKLDKDGNWKWSNIYGSTGIDNGNSIGIDNDQNIYIAGEFSETIDFDAGPSTVNHTSLANLDGYLLKIDTLGNYIWSRSFQCTSAIYNYGIAIDQNSKCYLTGTFQGTMDVNPSVESSLINSNGDWDIYVMAIDSSGSFLWGSSIGGNNGSDKSNAIATDNDNNIYITGYVGQNVDLDPGIGTIFMNNTGFNTMFLLKLDQFGTFQWAEIVGTELGKGSGIGITVDNSNNIYACGSFFGTFEVQIGGNSAQLSCNGAVDIFAFKLGNTTSLKELDISFEINPNPCNETINLFNPFTTLLDIQIINEFGMVLKTISITPGNNIIDMARFANGVYILKSTYGTNAQKIIKL